MPQCHTQFRLKRMLTNYQLSIFSVIPNLKNMENMQLNINLLHSALKYLIYSTIELSLMIFN